MARKRHSDEDILKLLREIEVKLSSGSDPYAPEARNVGATDMPGDWPGAQLPALPTGQ